jgi:hypothetical protein
MGRGLSRPSCGRLRPPTWIARPARATVCQETPGGCPSPTSCTPPQAGRRQAYFRATGAWICSRESHHAAACHSHRKACHPRVSGRSSDHLAGGGKRRLLQLHPLADGPRGRRLLGTHPRGQPRAPGVAIGRLWGRSLRHAGLKRRRKALLSGLIGFAQKRTACQEQTPQGRARQPRQDAAAARHPNAKRPQRRSRLSVESGTT